MGKQSLIAGSLTNGRAFLAGLILATSISSLSHAQTSSISSTADLPKMYQKLQVSAPLVTQLTAALTKIERVGAKDNAPIPHLDEFARLILRTSSVEWSADRRYAILFSMFSDLFTVIQFNEKASPTAVFFANGEKLGLVIGGGKVSEEKDFIRRLFQQRPKLQRDLALLLGQDERGILAALSGLQTDTYAAKLVAVGLLLQVKGMEGYENAPCRDVVERYRQSETFFLRFPRGRTDGVLMKPQALVPTSNADNFALQDDRLARQTAFLEVSEAPNCRVKNVRLFFAY